MASRIGPVLGAVGVTAVGLLLVVGAWTAWDPMPPGGPALDDADRTYEIVMGLLGLGLVACGAWLAIRAARSTRSANPGGR